MTVSLSLDNSNSQMFSYKNQCNMEKWMSEENVECMHMHVLLVFDGTLIVSGIQLKIA